MKVKAYLVTLYCPELKMKKIKFPSNDRLELDIKLHNFLFT